MKKTLCLLLVAMTVLSCSVSTLAHGNNSELSITGADAFEQSIVDEVCERVVESYAEYYNIPQISGEVREKETVIGGSTYIIDVSFTKVLLADDASDLPYIQGMRDTVIAIKDLTLQAEAQKALDARTYEINTLYIGVEQIENSTFKVFVPITSTRMNVDDYTITFVCDFGEMPMSVFEPQSKEELYQNGVIAAENVAINNVTRVATATKTNPSDATDYDRLKAKEYVETYSCGSCTTSPHACRNEDYTFYNGSDCANFVSQAIYYAGISTEDNWEPYTITWINTGFKAEHYGLVEYMVDQGFFFEETDKFKAFAGSIMYWNQYSHVGMVNANDTVTMTFCSHTSDKNSCSFRYWTGADKDTDVKFFIPVWDSYANQYTPQS